MRFNTCPPGSTSARSQKKKPTARKPAARKAKSNHATPQKVAVFDVERVGRAYTITTFWYFDDRNIGHMQSLDAWPKKKALDEAQRLAKAAVSSGDQDRSRVTINDQSSVVGEFVRA